MSDLFENKLFRVCLITIIVIILIIVILAAVIGSGSKTLTENSLISAAQRYYKDNPSALPKEVYDSRRVNVSTLVLNGYISSKVNGVECPSYATVTNMNGVYQYSATLLCNGGTNSYTTLLSKMLSNRVTSGAGLYDVNGKYAYRGENPNNYVQFANSLWRILGVDENNNIKIVYYDIYTQYQAWDDRYNKDIDDWRGINDYVGNEKSRIKEYLDGIFNDEIFKEGLTFDQIALMAKHNVCIGKLNSSSKVSSICNKTLDNQLVTTITVSDYINASLDKSCSLSNSINCQNYNFLSNNTWTINASSDNSYDVYYIDAEEGLKPAYASFGNAIRPVVALKNSTIYVAGTGTHDDPYLIK